ncbi:O-antigen ligase family protein [Flavobacteriaceae bacterium]|nr:O-antigen ligase family protein [Flavobacteriaceae bacterium]
MKAQGNIVLTTLSPVFLILFLCIAYIPNLEAVDKIAPQWLAMSIINTVTLFFIYFQRKNIIGHLAVFFNTYLSYLYVFFIIWAALSYFYAINQTEVIVNITRQFNVMIMYFNMGILLSQIKGRIKFTLGIVIFFLAIEVYAVLDQALEMINSSGIITGGALKGLTANRNITAFSIAVKIPFLLYFLYSAKKKQYKFFGSVLFALSLISLSMIQSRASLLATFFAISVFIILNIFMFFKVEKRKKYWVLIAYTIVPVIFTLFVNQVYLAKKGADIVSRAATIAEVTTDDSITARIRYYSSVLEHLSHNPVFGVGLGNWKLKSIDYDKYNVTGYVVPYHAHSDFIQLGAELGWIGFFSYLGIFIIIIFFVFKLISKSTHSIDNKVFFFLLLTGLGVYSVDSSLNFPIARPHVLVIWTLILALVNEYYAEFFKPSDRKDVKSSVYSYGMILIILLLTPTIFVTNSVYNSLKGQMFLLQDFNSNQYNVPMTRIDNIVPEIPNITVTTIPINSVKARYYFNAKKYDKAIALLDEGTNANPYLYYSEVLKSQIYLAKGQLDSAAVYAKKAFFGLPNNALHASHYINIMNQTRDRDALEEAFELLVAKNDLNNWKNYLIVASQLYPINDAKLISRATKAAELFPLDDNIKSLYRNIIIGPDAIAKAAAFSNAAQKLFSEADYTNAAVNFENAIQQNPLEYSYYENAATANYLIGNLDKAIEQIDVVINDMNPLNGKCEYIKALIYIKLGDPIGACPLLKTAIDSGQTQAEPTFNQYCNQ